MEDAGFVDEGWGYAMLCCDVAVRCKPIDTQLRQCIEYSVAGAISRMVLFTNRVDNYVKLLPLEKFGDTLGLTSSKWTNPAVNCQLLGKYPLSPRQRLTNRSRTH